MAASSQREIIQLIKQVSGQANILTIPRIFIDLTGDIKSALFLSQCIYWSDKTSREDGFFYKSYQDWERETGLKRRGVDAARRDCAAFVEVKITQANGAPTMHYRVDFDALATAIYGGMQKQSESICTDRTNRFDQSVQNGFVQNVQNDLPDSYKSLTETTTKITPETTAEKKRITPDLDEDRKFIDDFLEIARARKFGAADGDRQIVALLDLRETYGSERVLAAARWAWNKPGMTIPKSIRSLQTALPQWGDSPPAGGATGPSPLDVLDRMIADERAKKIRHPVEELANA